MQVKVTCTFNLTADLAEVNRLEAEVFALGRKLLAQMLARALAALDEGSEKGCPDCSSCDLVADGTVPYRLRTRRVAAIGPLISVEAAR